MNALWGIVLSNSLMVGGLALGIVLLGRVWRHAAVLHVLWILALIKLFLPPVLVTQWPRGFASLVANTITNTAAVGNEEASLAPPVTSSNLPAKSESRSATSNKIPQTPKEAIVQKNHTSVETSEVIPWLRGLAAIWLVGTVILTVKNSLAILRFRRLLDEAQPASVETNRTVAALAKQLGLTYTPKVRMTTAHVTPLVWSLGSEPVLVLPRELFSRLDRAAQESILIHELAHLRRRDHLARLLELAVTTVFWWHPVAWLARNQMRELEEECCDQIVVNFDPRRKRAYATALVDTLDFLSERVVCMVPLSTTILSTGSLVCRIKRLEQPSANRLTFAGGLALAILLSAPLSLGFAAAVADGVPTISGRITDQAGKPIADALVRVVTPATDMRFVDEEMEGMYEGRTDKDGRYEIKLEGIEEPTTVSVDALAPGYQRLSSQLQMYRERVVRDVGPGENADASFTMEPGLYVKGIVVDEAGQPIANVRVGANTNRYGLIDGMERIVSSGGVERTRGREDGTFEVFNFLVEPLAMDGQPEKGMIIFGHKDYVPYHIVDVYALSDEERTNLRIVLPTGSQATGRVVDAEGQPVPNVLIEVLEAKLKNRDKATTTDADGKFQFKGLEKQDALIRVHAMNLRQKATVPVNLNEDQLNLEIRLEPLSIAEEPQGIEVLGMKLTDITPELRDRYDLGKHDKGALILDPGIDSARLGVGELREGYHFWLAGKDDNEDENYVTSVREFLEALLKEAEKPATKESGCRVVYSFRDERMVGTNTQYMKLTEDDIKSLRETLKTLN
jgi:beta-lactamase regulating signal transducer with metallopeptidase domain